MCKADWQISLNGTDVTGLAQPIERAGTPLVNVTAVAAAFGLESRVENGTMYVTDTTGTEWSATDGAVSLSSNGRTLPLVAPVSIQGPNAFLAVKTLAALANMSSDIDPATHKVIVAKSVLADQAAGNDGWLDIVIPKTDSEIAQQERSQGTSVSSTQSSNQTSFLPPDHDSMHFSVGTGYVQGADGGVTVSGSGVADGINVELNALETEGYKGFQYEYGQVALTDATRGLRFEAGNIFSDLYGVGTGVRLGVRDGTNRLASFTFYAPTNVGDGHPAALSYENEFRITRQLTSGAEVATDGSFLLKQRLLAGPFALYGYTRFLKEGDDKGVGLFGSFAFAPGLNVSAGFSHSDALGTTDDWKTVSVTAPIGNGLSLTVGRSTTNTNTASSDLYNTSLSMPIHGMQFVTTYQFGSALNNIGTLAPGAVGFSAHQQSLGFLVGLPVTPRARFDYQASTRWQDNTSPTHWEQLLSTLHLSHSNDLQVISAFPAVFDEDELHIRLVHNISADRSMTLDYGQLQPYQGIGAAQGDRGFQLMMNQSLSVRTPATGGRISGRVIDLMGRPMSHVEVYLGGYHRPTDDKGGFQFDNVPEGSYQLYVDEASLPANFKDPRSKFLIDVSGTSKSYHEFQVVPLGSISGTVFDDRNDNGKCDAGEGVKNAVIRLGGQATMTDEDGHFSFYNVTPGPQVLMLDVQRLPLGDQPSTSPRIDAVLAPDSSLTNMDFAVQFHDKPIVYQEL